MAVEEEKEENKDVRDAKQLSAKLHFLFLKLLIAAWHKDFF